MNTGPGGAVSIPGGAASIPGGAAFIPGGAVSIIPGGAASIPGDAAFFHELQPLRHEPGCAGSILGTRRFYSRGPQE
eukprot:scaffold35529_cov73-Isochrysis_galbana.AAC.1